jgi:uncharacterized protein YjbJ (UPF0337 family)
MKPSTKNKIEGKVHEVKRKIKEQAGHLANDPNLEAEGIGEKVAGTIQKRIGKAEKGVEIP